MNPTNSPTLMPVAPNTLYPASESQRLQGVIDKAIQNRTHDGGLRLRPTYQALLTRACVGLNLTLIAAFGSVTATSTGQRIVNVIQSAAHEPPHAIALRSMMQMAGLSKTRLTQLFGVSRPTIDAWLQGNRLFDEHRKRIFAVEEVLKRALVRYPTPELLSSWLDMPRGLDGRTPFDLLAANEIDRARALAISTPSSGLMRQPAWVGRPVAEMFRVAEEDRAAVDDPAEDLGLDA